MNGFQTRIRLWDKYKKIMLPSFPLYKCNFYDIDTFKYEIMFSIGIKDKQGKEIFEGDVIQLSCGCCFYKIVWNAEKLCWWPKDDGYSQVHEKDINVWECELEIIDNIHENKKILKDKL